MEIQKTSNSQSNLENEEWNRRNQPAGLQTIHLKVPGSEASGLWSWRAAGTWPRSGTAPCSPSGCQEAGSPPPSRKTCQAARQGAHLMTWMEYHSRDESWSLAWHPSPWTLAELPEPQFVTHWDSRLPWWSPVWEPTLRCSRHRFHPWSGETPHAVEQLLQPVCSRAHRPQPEKPPQWDPITPPLEKTRVQQQRPSKANKQMFKKLRYKWHITFKKKGDPLRVSYWMCLRTKH